MSEKRANLEMIAPTVDEAIANGLEELGLPRDAVEIEVLDEGNRGLFGLGSRQARVRLTVKNAPQAQPEAQPERQPERPVKAEPEITFRSEPWSPQALAAAKKVETKEPAPRSSGPASSSKPSAPAVDEDAVLQATRETTSELLKYMQIDADLSVTYGEPDERQSRPPVLVDISGQDLSILIGKRADTLQALQYIVSLIVSKKIGHNTTIVIDVEKYRERRESQIRVLARRMADQALKTGRRQVLEPMPASERRIVHMELRQNLKVRTESIGDEPYRKVTISPSED